MGEAPIFGEQPRRSRRERRRQSRRRGRWGRRWEHFSVTAILGLHAWLAPEAQAAELIAPEEAALHTVRWSGSNSSRSVFLSGLLHVALVITPLPGLLLSALPAQAPPVEETLDVAWTGTSAVLPPIYPGRHAKPKPSPGGQPDQPLPPLGADAVARQTIVSNPPQPNHPTQTLLSSLAQEKARVRPQEFRAPNMVIPPSEAAPVSEIDLRRLRVPNAPIDLSGPPHAPVAPQMKSQSALGLKTPELKNLYARLTVPPSAPGQGAPGAPETVTPTGVPRSGDLAAPELLALSANPGAASPVLRLPDSNLRARFAVGPYAGSGSPGGVPGGVPGAHGGSGGGPGGEAGGNGGLTAPDIYVAPAGPVPQGPVVVGSGMMGGEPAPPAPKAPPPAPKPKPKPAPAPKEAKSQPPARPAPTQQQQSPSAAAKPAPAAPALTLQQRAENFYQEVKSGKGKRRMYVTYLYLANLTSQSSSWLIQYAEKSEPQPGDPPLLPPEVVKKVDPCYPTDGRLQRVEGTVVLYGVLRPDGNMEDVTVVRGISAAVDHEAARALADSRFSPVRKRGVPVAAEAIVEIPFRLAPCL